MKKEDWIDDRCVLCKAERTPEGHDPCIANLPGVLFACCGHGNKVGYIKFVDGRCLRFTPTEVDLDLPSAGVRGIPTYQLGTARVFKFDTGKLSTRKYT